MLLLIIFSRYHIPSDSWEVVSPAINSSKSPSRRYGHSVIAHNVSIILSLQFSLLFVSFSFDSYMYSYKYVDVCPGISKKLR